MSRRKIRAIPDTPAKIVSRLRTLARELDKDISYAENAIRNDYWTEYQKRRSARSINSKKTECRKLIDALPQGAPLLDAIEAYWSWLAQNWRQPGYDHDGKASKRFYDLLAKAA